MIRILTVIGARPQIIKAAALSRAVQAWNAEHGADARVEEHILHTGQHYDANMSDIFIQQLQIPEPTYNLHVGSGTHGAQTAKMIEGIEHILLQAQQDGKAFDAVVLYGDTNSTLAGAVAASKMHVPVCHVEAGLRSYNMAMPEELNRIACDHLSSLLFPPTQTAMDNLQHEGLIGSPAVFAQERTRQAVLSGDVMYDNSMFFATIAEQQSTVLQTLGLQKKQLMLATIHRDNNTDDPQRLSGICRALLAIGQQSKQTIVWPLHPRTKKLLPANMDASLYNDLLSSAYIKIVEPQSFFDIILLEKYASLVLTDSGGVQKESFFFETPCVILRPQTEWVEIVESGAGIIADADEQRIVSAYQSLLGHAVRFPQCFGDGHAADRILSAIVAYIQPA